METKELILDQLKKEKLAVISTISKEHLPQAAVVEFGQTNKLELIFDTFSNSRKYRNLQDNQVIAAVIGWDDNITIQYEGVAKELNGAELIKCKAIYFQKNPDAKRWENEPDIRHFLVTPTWVRYSDLSKKPWKVLELHDF